MPVPSFRRHVGTAVVAQELQCMGSRDCIDRTEGRSTASMSISRAGTPGNREMWTSSAKHEMNSMSSTSACGISSVRRGKCRSSNGSREPAKVRHSPLAAVREPRWQLAFLNWPAYHAVYSWRIGVLTLSARSGHR